MVKDKPIIMTGESVSAIIDGRKTQTRRVIRPQPESKIIYFTQNKDDGFHDYKNRFHCPYGVVGDRLWVRERIDNGLQACNFYYHADNKGVGQNNYNWILARGWKFKRVIPSVFMPKILARIWLEITNIRVEKVQDISQEDIEAEGLWHTSAEYRHEICVWRNCVEAIHSTRVKYFRQLWDSLNAKRGYDWSENPFVWVIEFKRCSDGK